jgi:6-phospho-beta-glucosidase
MTGFTLAVLGGSSVATPELISSLLDWCGTPERRPSMRLILIGRSREKLDRIAVLCKQLTQNATPDLDIEATTDLRQGLQGADVVLNQMRVGGLEARAHDETFPRALGFAGEETIGPGGFANALRSIPVVLEALRVVSEAAPAATIINLTNPAGMVQQAAMLSLGLSIVSVCDSPTTLCASVASLAGAPQQPVEVGYLGLNHLGWALSVHRDGRDVLDETLAVVEQLPNLVVDPAYIRSSRAIPQDYVRYFFYPERMLALQQGQIPRASQLLELEATLLKAYATADLAPVGRRGALWYSTIVVPVLDALINDRNTLHIVCAANAALVPWLPTEAVIETWARVNSTGVHPLPPESEHLASELRQLLQAEAAYESLATQAIVETRRDLALRALVAHPLIRSLERARQVLDAVWPEGGAG